MKSILFSTCVSLMAISLIGCGGGGGGDGDDSEPTYRPKTLAETVLLLDSNIKFEFRRNNGTAAALNNGDIETGTFTYTQGGVQVRQYPNLGGSNSDCIWPDSINSASYTYQAINESSALLILSGIALNDNVYTGSFNVSTGRNIYFFDDRNSSLDLLDPLNPNQTTSTITQVEINLTFNNNNNQYVTVDSVTVGLSGSTSPDNDVVRIPASFALSTGGAVSVNYNPVIVYESIALESLNSILMKFTNGAGNTANDFTIDFVKDSTQTSSGATTEIGQGLLRVGTTVVTGAVNYTWTLIDGTDTGTLVISNANSTLDGSYTLTFTGTDNGSYAGTLDTLTTDITDVTGTFTIIGSP